MRHLTTAVVLSLLLLSLSALEALEARTAKTGPGLDPWGGGLAQPRGPASPCERRSQSDRG